MRLALLLSVLLLVAAIAFSYGALVGAHVI